MRGKKAAPVSDIIRNSLIVSLLIRFSEFLSTAFSQSFFGHLLCGNYRRERGSLWKRISEALRLKQRVSIPFKRFTAKAVDHSFLLGKINGLLRQAPDLHIKNIGAFFFAFGLYVSVSYLIRRFALNLPGASFRELYLGIVCAAAGGAMTSSSRRLADALRDSRILSFLLFTVLGLKKTAFRGSQRSCGRSDAAFLIGIAVGALSAFVSPFSILAGIGLLILGYAILVVPECGVVCLFLVFPFLSTGYIALLSAYVTVCWLLKLARGKRVFSMNPLDVAVLAFMGVIFLGGLISVSPDDSMREAAVCLILMTGYFLTVNLIRTSEWFERCIRALVFSLSVTVLFAAAEFVLLKLPGFPSGAIPRLPSGMLSPIADPVGFADLLILAVPFLSVFLITARKGDTGFGLTILTLLSLLCLLLTRSRGGWVAALIGGMLFLLLYSKKAVSLLLVLLLLLPVIPVFFPSSAAERLGQALALSDSGLAFRTAIADGTDKLLSECLIGGIGVGDTVFRRVFPLFAPHIAEEAAHTYNLYTRITVSLGITGLIVFALFFLVFLRHFASCYAAGRKDERRLRLSAAAGFSGIAALLAHGLVDYVWYNNRIFLLFWLVVGLTSAAIRTGVRERVTQEPEGLSLELDIGSLKRASSRRRNT